MLEAFLTNLNKRDKFHSKQKNYTFLVFDSEWWTFHVFDTEIAI